MDELEYKITLSAYQDGVKYLKRLFEHDLSFEFEELTIVEENRVLSFLNLLMTHTKNTKYHLEKLTGKKH